MLTFVLNVNFCLLCDIIFFQEEMQLEMEPIPYSELTDMEVLGEGGFGLVYKAKHQQFGTVVYKELDARKLGNRYLKYAISLLFHLPSLEERLATQWTSVLH